MTTFLKTTGQALGVVLVASALGLTYNSVRGDGLNLSRDFFKKAAYLPPPQEPRPDEKLEGFNTLTTGGVVELLRDLPDAVAVVDARSRAKYEDGHIPGAHYLNHYQSDKLIDGVLPHLEEAVYLIVYCDGGDCDDSVHLATDLHQVHQVELERLFVYKGGMEHWKQAGLPVRTGAERGTIPRDLTISDDAESARSSDPAPAVDPPSEGAEASDGAAQPPDDEHAGHDHDHGLQSVTTAEAREYSTELRDASVFVDARSRSKYDEGHIPGAVYLNHYQSDKLIESVKPLLDEAVFVIVYCDGGDCEDSIHLATDLIEEYGIDFGKIYLYEGGMREWLEAGYPVVKGPNRE